MKKKIIVIIYCLTNGKFQEIRPLLVLYYVLYFDKNII